MNWEPGRQEGGYFKRKLFGWSWGDCYLLRYPKKSHVRPHLDPVENRRHFRLNVVLKKARRGGIFYGGSPLLKLGRATLFRPDLHTHAVSEIEAGTRWVLSVGWTQPL